MISVVPSRTYFWPRSEEPHYEFDKELRAKLAAHKAKEAMTGEEGAGEGWVNLSSEQLTEGSMNGLVSSTSEQITESERQVFSSGQQLWWVMSSSSCSAPPGTCRSCPPVQRWRVGPRTRRRGREPGPRSVRQLTAVGSCPV